MPPADMLDVRCHDGVLEERVSVLQGMALAIRGEVEGVGPASGRIRYLRKLPEGVRTAEVTVERVVKSASSVVAQTNLGVYSQALETGHVWAYCLLRAEGI